MDIIKDIPIGIFTIITALSVILGGFTLQRYIVFNQAAAEFRKAFDAEFTIALYNGFTTDKFRIVFNKHKEAVRIFEPYVSFFNRNSFNNKWKCYEKWANKILTNSKGKSDGTYTIELGFEKRNINTEFRNHIESLLKFAKHK